MTEMVSIPKSEYERLKALEESDELTDVKRQIELSLEDLKAGRITEL